MANSYSAVFLTGNHGSTVPLYLQLSFFFFSVTLGVIGYICNWLCSYVLCFP